MNSSIASDSAVEPSRDGVAGCCDAGVESSWLAVLASSRFRRLSREFFWVGLGQAATVLGAVVGVRILTGILTPQAYGELALGMTVATLATQTVLGPLGNAAMRFFAPAREAGALQSYLAAVKRLLLEASGTTGALAFVLILILGVTGQRKWVGLVLAATLFALLSGYNSVLNGMQNAARQRAIVALHHALATWGRFLLAAGLVLWLGDGATVAMLGYAAAIVLALLSQSWFFRRTIHARRRAISGDRTHNNETWRARMLSYAWPFVTWAFLEWAKMASGRWGLQVFCTTKEVGYYAVLYQLGYYPLTLLTQLATSFLSPIYFQRIGDASNLTRVRGVHRFGARLTWLAIVLTVVATVAVALFHRQLFFFLVAAEYRTVSYLLPGMILAGGLGAAARFITTLFQARLRVKDLIVPRVASETLGLFANIAGAALFGVLGVVLANVMYAVISLVWIGSVFRRVPTTVSKEE